MAALQQTGRTALSTMTIKCRSVSEPFRCTWTHVRGPLCTHLNNISMQSRVFRQIQWAYDIT